MLEKKLYIFLISIFISMNLLVFLNTDSVCVSLQCGVRHNRFTDHFYYSMGSNFAFCSAIYNAFKHNLCINALMTTKCLNATSYDLIPSNISVAVDLSILIHILTVPSGYPR